MITHIKRALLGADIRTNGGWVRPSRTVTDTDEAGAEPEVGDLDPFRPAIDHDDGADHDQVEMDQLFGILGNQRRRYVLKYLSMSEGPVTLNDLTDQIAAWEYQKEPARLTSEERQRVYVSLYQCHLPKMAAGSAISYDQQQSDIEHGEQFDLFSYYLRDE